MNVTVPTDAVITSLFRVDRVSGAPSEFYAVADGENIQITETEYLERGGEPKVDA